jgi:hypothetical protein
MTAWASNCSADGGFYRIRATGKPCHMPVGTEARKETYTITFSDPLPASGVFKVKVWDIKRTENYGSDHYDGRELRIEKAEIRGNKLILRIPDLAPTRGMEISCEFEGGIKRVVHASIHHLP